MSAARDALDELEKANQPAPTEAAIDHAAHHFSCTWSIRGRHFRGVCTCGAKAETAPQGAPRETPACELCDNHKHGFTHEHSPECQARYEADTSPRGR